MNKVMSLAWFSTSLRKSIGRWRSSQPEVFTCGGLPVSGRTFIGVSPKYSTASRNRLLNLPKVVKHRESIHMNPIDFWVRLVNYQDSRILSSLMEKIIAASFSLNTIFLESLLYSQ
jgi:hypothetical protein